MVSEETSQDDEVTKVPEEHFPNIIREDAEHYEHDERLVEEATLENPLEERNSLEVKHRIICTCISSGLLR